MLYQEKAYDKLDFQNTLLSFLHGFRFDFSIIFTFYGIPTLLLLVPWKRSWWASAIVKISFIWLVSTSNIFLFLLFGDLFYFKQVNRHVFDELVTLSGEWSFIYSSLTSGYLFYVIGYLVFVCFAGVYLFKMLDSQFRYREKWTSFLLFLFAAVLLIRGGVGLKPISVVDAFRYGGSQGGQLALNGVFSAWHASRNRSVVRVPNISPDDLVFLSHKLQLDPANPFRVKYQPSFSGQPNIVIVLLESWANKYIRSFGGKEFNVTPYFDSLSEKGLKFENFYATGSRSIEAIQSILTSFPSLKGLPNLGHGFELMNTAELGSLAREVGRESYFFQAAQRESFRLNSVAAAYGFEHYFGSEDYPVLLYPDKKAPAFGWDYEMFMAAKDVFDAAEKPFLAFMFTGTTHTPFVNSEKHLYSDKHGPENEFGFLNSLNYSDWAIEQFMESAKESQWFENTIFIFTADHSLQTYRKFEFLEGYQVPLLIYSPKYVQPAKRYQFSGHLDILPTVIDMIGSKGFVSTVGRSLLNPRDYNYAFLSKRYSNPAWVDSEGYIISDFEKILEKDLASVCSSKCLDEKHRLLKAMNGYLYKSIRNNTWSRKD